MAIGVIGLGYVGLPLAVEFAEAGEPVIAVDVDDAKVASIGAGRSYIEDIPSPRLQAAPERIQADTDFAVLAEADAVLICVPTPLTGNREPDLTPLLGAAGRWPRSCSRDSWSFWSRPRIPARPVSRWRRCSRRAVCRPAMEINVAFSPERVDPGRTDYTMRNTPKIVGGLTDSAPSAPPRCTSASATR